MPLPIELAEVYYDEAIRKHRPKDEKWFVPEPGEWPPILYVRFGIWIWHPDTGEYRKVFEEGNTKYEDLRGHHLLDIVPDFYWHQGYLPAGIELYIYEHPKKTAFLHESFRREALDAYSKKRERQKRAKNRHTRH